MSGLTPEHEQEIREWCRVGGVVPEPVRELFAALDSTRAELAAERAHADNLADVLRCAAPYVAGDDRGECAKVLTEHRERRQ